MTEGIRKSGNDRGRDLTNVIFADKTERTIPQSAFGSQLPLHKGAIEGVATAAAAFSQGELCGGGGVTKPNLYLPLW